jgi:hypothetical protein
MDAAAARRMYHGGCLHGRRKSELFWREYRPRIGGVTLSGCRDDEVGGVSHKVPFMS